MVDQEVYEMSMRDSAEKSKYAQSHPVSAREADEVKIEENE